MTEHLVWGIKRAVGEYVQFNVISFKNLWQKKSKNTLITKKEIEELLSQQTLVILNAVDKKLEKFETKISIRIDKLRNSIDKFVTLYTKQEQELTLVIEDIRKIKEVIKEKLGIEIT